MCFNRSKNILILSFLLLLIFGIACKLSAPKEVIIWMIGDSTMCEYQPDRYPITGWGMPFKDYFDSPVTIKNKARGGRSTRTFLEENRWKPIVDSLKEGDYVLIQFGHNDEAKDYPDRYAPPDDYKKNLVKFITETRSKNAKPILITPVSRRYFDSHGKIEETHKPYSGIVRDLGQKYNVSVIDLDEMSRKLFQDYGPENSKFLFMQIEKGQDPHYPEGIHGNTHFNRYGARHIAELVLKGIQNLHLNLADRIVKK